MSSIVSPLCQKRKGVEETSIFNSAKRLRHVEEKATSNNNAPQTKYDVFVSFRGEIRNGFISHLIDAFERNHINAFVDDILEKGKEVGSSLDGAIKESAISLIIFSQKYAYSRWCLNELVTILKCSDENGQTVIPVFYKVKPTHVRHQSSKSYKKAFVKHQENNETNIQIWRYALERAANISGIESSSWKKDAELVKEIVRLVLEKSSIKPAVNTKGMGGLGKTTSSGVVFHKLQHEYGGSCLLLNERDRSNKESIMARMCDKIKVINGTKETLKLRVRIISLWDCTNRDRTSQVEMVVMDSKGDKIQVVVRKDEVECWKEKLVEGKCYLMHNFRVVSNEGQYKVCDHPFKLVCTSGTSIIESDDPKIPLNMYNFKDFGDVISGNYRRDLLVDIIGGVERIIYNGLNNNLKKNGLSASGSQW